MIDQNGSKTTGAATYQTPHTAPPVVARTLPAAAQLDVDVVTPVDRVRWGPILAGLFAALATLAVLAILGLAIGASAFTPGDQGSTFGLGAGIWGAVSTLLAFGVGGWIAARTAAVRGRSSGILNGAMVWFVAIPLLIYALGAGIGAIATTPGPNRTGRVARMAVRACSVTLRLRHHPSPRRSQMQLNCVEIREVSPRPAGERALHWRLLTNVDPSTEQALQAIVRSYTGRWRIEELYRTWKSGACRVEDSQVRSVDALKKWATLMINVAARIERIKVRSRTEPELLADTELNKYEIQALVLLKRKYKKRTETIPDGIPTLAQAVLWLAEIGGYTGKSSGGPPGSITIRRGYEDIAQAAALLEVLESEGRLR